MVSNITNGTTAVASNFTLNFIGGSFNSAIVFTTPFLYDPSKGNLLIQFTGGPGAGFSTDAQTTGRTGASRAGSGFGAEVDQVEATQFVFNPAITGAPEVNAETAALPISFVLGLLCLVHDARRRMQMA